MIQIKSNLLLAVICDCATPSVSLILVVDHIAGQSCTHLGLCSVFAGRERQQHLAEDQETKLQLSSLEHSLERNCRLDIVCMGLL